MQGNVFDVSSPLSLSLWMSSKFFRKVFWDEEMPFLAKDWSVTYSALEWVAVADLQKEYSAGKDAVAAHHHGPHA